MPSLHAVLAMTLACSILIAAGGAAEAQSARPLAEEASDTTYGRALEAPSDPRPPERKFWWRDDWYERGLIPVPVNHETIERPERYAVVGGEVQAALVRPKAAGRFPAVLFLHGRRGPDDLVMRHVRRIAARGFVVLAPDLYESRFIPVMPVEHRRETEADADAGLAHLLRLPDVATTRACLYSHTRGGYYALRIATTLDRQSSAAACFVSYYPHLQDPNAPEPDQVYRYAPEVDRLTLPTLIFMGEYEQYQRRRSIETAVSAMKARRLDVRLIVYPGVGRGFDFRPPSVRTFADDLAAMDAIQRAAAFMQQHLGTSQRP